MHYLFWLVILSPYLFWLHSLWSLPCPPVLYLLARSPACFPYALSTLPVPILLYPEPLTWLLVYDIVTLCLHRILGWWLTSLYHSLGLWLSSPLPLPYYQSLTHLSACLSLYYYLQSGPCSFPLHI
jgi:hypothetical protein